jgi:hypothetical protein
MEEASCSLQKISDIFSSSAREHVLLSAEGEARGQSGGRRMERSGTPGSSAREISKLLTPFNEVIASDPFQNPTLWRTYDLLLNARDKQLNALYGIEAF